MKKSSAIFLSVFVVILTAICSLFLGAFVAGQVDFSDFFSNQNVHQQVEDFVLNDDLSHNEDMSLEQNHVDFDGEDLNFGDEHLYAIKFLGYGDQVDLSGIDADFIDVYGDEYYLIIPRFEDTEVKIKMLDYGDFSDMDSPEMLTVFTSKNSDPFVLKCNVSDIYSNVAVIIKGSGGSAGFSPRISLEDGSLITGDLGLEIK